MKHLAKPSLTAHLDRLFNSLAATDKERAGEPSTLKMHYLGVIKRLLSTAAPYCRVPATRASDAASYLLEHLTPFQLTSQALPPEPGIYLAHSGLFVGFSTWNGSAWSTFFYDFAANKDTRTWMWHASDQVNWAALDFKPTGQTPKSPTSKAPNPSSLT